MARVESEAGIIATLIHHPEFSYYSEQLLPNHFTNEENRYIYQAICSLARDGITTIDPYNIIQALSAKEATRRFADELSIDQLYTLMDNSDSIARMRLLGGILSSNSKSARSFALSRPKKTSNRKSTRCWMM